MYVRIDKGKHFVMKKISILIVAAFLLSGSSLYAKWKDKQGNIIEDTESIKSHGDFGAQLLLIGDEKTFFKNWNTPSHTVNLDTISALNRGDSVITPIIFAGCTKNSEGKCHITVDYQMIQPDNKDYAVIPNMTIISPKMPVHSNDILELGLEYPKFVFEPQDPTGQYTLHAKITDHIKGATITLTQHLTLYDNNITIKQEKPASEDQRPSQLPPPNEKQKALSQWLTYFYQHPNTPDTLQNIQAMFTEGFFNKTNSVAPLIMFLADVLRQNEKKLPKWKNDLLSIPEETQKYMLISLYEANTPNSKVILEELKRTNQKSLVEHIQQNPPIDLKTVPITSPAILDMLWATFMASGDELYVKRIVETLSLSTDLEDRNQRINNLLLIGSAKWSLASNAIQHPLVLTVCKRYQNSKDPNIKKHILEVLKNVDNHNNKEVKI